MDVRINPPSECKASADAESEENKGIVRSFLQFVLQERQTLSLAHSLSSKGRYDKPTGVYQSLQAILRYYIRRYCTDTAHRTNETRAAKCDQYCKLRVALPHYLPRLRYRFFDHDFDRSAATGTWQSFSVAGLLHLRLGHQHARLCLLLTHYRGVPWSGLRRFVGEDVRGACASGCGFLLLSGKSRHRPGASKYIDVWEGAQLLDGCGHGSRDGMARLRL